MKYKIIVVLLCLSSAFNLKAMSLEEAWQQVVTSNPDILAYQENLKSSESDVKLAKYDLCPSGSISGSYSSSGESELDDESMSYRISVSQPLYQGGNLLRSLKNSKIQYTKAENQYQTLLLSMRVDLETKYYNLLEQKELLKTATDEMEFIEKNLEIAQVKYDNGNLALSELLQWQSQKAQQQVSILQLQNNLKIANANLKQLLNNDDLTSIDKINIDKYEKHIKSLSSIDIDKLSDHESNLLSYSLKQNPSLQNNQLDMELSSNAVKSTKSNFLPKLSLSLSKGWNYQELDADPQNSLSLGLSASIPIFPMVDNIEKYTQSKYQLKQTEYSILSDELDMKTEVRKNLLNLLASVSEMQASQVAVDYAKETYQQAEEQFKNDMISSNDLLDIQISLSSAENQYTGKFYDFLVSKAELQQTLGILDEAGFWEVVLSEGK